MSEVLEASDVEVKPAFPSRPDSPEAAGAAAPLAGYRRRHSAGEGGAHVIPSRSNSMSSSAALGPSMRSSKIDDLNRRMNQLLGSIDAALEHSVMTEEVNSVILGHPPSVSNSTVGAGSRTGSLSAVGGARRSRSIDGGLGPTRRRPSGKAYRSVNSSREPSARPVVGSESVASTVLSIETAYSEPEPRPVHQKQRSARQARADTADLTSQPPSLENTQTYTQQSSPRSPSFTPSPSPDVDPIVVPIHDRDGNRRGGLEVTADRVPVPSPKSYNTSRTRREEPQTTATIDFGEPAAPAPAAAAVPAEAPPSLPSQEGARRVSEPTLMASPSNQAAPPVPSRSPPPSQPPASEPASTREVPAAAVAAAAARTPSPTPRSVEIGTPLPTEEAAQRGRGGHLMSPSPVPVHANPGASVLIDTPPPGSYSTAPRTPVLQLQSAVLPNYSKNGSVSGSVWMGNSVGDSSQLRPAPSSQPASGPNQPDSVLERYGPTAGMVERERIRDELRNRAETDAAIERALQRTELTAQALQMQHERNPSPVYHRRESPLRASSPHIPEGERSAAMVLAARKLEELAELRKAMNTSVGVPNPAEGKMKDIAVGSPEKAAVEGSPEVRISTAATSPSSPRGVDGSTQTPRPDDGAYDAYPALSPPSQSPQRRSSQSGSRDPSPFSYPNSPVTSPQRQFRGQNTPQANRRPPHHHHHHHHHYQHHHGHHHHHRHHHQHHHHRGRMMAPQTPTGRGMSPRPGMHAGQRPQHQQQLQPPTGMRFALPGQQGQAPPMALSPNPHPDRGPSPQRGFNRDGTPSRFALNDSTEAPPPKTRPRASSSSPQRPPRSSQPTTPTAETPPIPRSSNNNRRRSSTPRMRQGGPPPRDLRWQFLQSVHNRGIMATSLQAPNSAIACNILIKTFPQPPAGPPRPPPPGFAPTPLPSQLVLHPAAHAGANGLDAPQTFPLEQLSWIAYPFGGRRSRLGLFCGAKARQELFRRGYPTKVRHDTSKLVFLGFDGALDGAMQSDDSDADDSKPGSLVVLRFPTHIGFVVFLLAIHAVRWPCVKRPLTRGAILWMLALHHVEAMLMEKRKNRRPFSRSLSPGGYWD